MHVQVPTYQYCVTMGHFSWFPFSPFLQCTCTFCTPVMRLPFLLLCNPSPARHMKAVLRRSQLGVNSITTQPGLVIEGTCMTFALTYINNIICSHEFCIRTSFSSFFLIIIIIVHSIGICMRPSTCYTQCIVFIPKWTGITNMVHTMYNLTCISHS